MSLPGASVRDHCCFPKAAILSASYLISLLTSFCILSSVFFCPFNALLQNQLPFLGQIKLKLIPASSVSATEHWQTPAQPPNRKVCK